MKRWRSPKAKPGELKMQWGKLPHSNPDLLYVWGPGVPSADASYLHYALSVDRQRTNYDAPLCSPRHLWTVFDPSFLKELEKRGYDLTTLRFSIQKKKEA